MNKKGLSSILGAIFMILIVGMLASAYFMFTLAQNTTYNDAVRSNNLAQMVAMSESVKIPAIATYTQAGSGVQVTVILENDGPVAVQIKTLWVSSSENDYGFVNLDLDLKSGESYQLNQELVEAKNGVLNSATCDGWVVTARGRTFELFPDHGVGPQGPQGEKGDKGDQGLQGIQGIQGVQGIPGTTSYDANTALVSQGIGSVAMNFAKFRNYDFGTSAPANGVPIASSVESTSYTIHDNHYYAIRIALLNMDVRTAKISIASNSYIWALNPQKGTLKSVSWNLMYFSPDQKLYYSNPGAPFYVDLPYNTETYVYFGIQKSEVGAAAIPTVVPLNILLFGNFVFANGTTAEYGQNLPFVALNIPYA